MAFSLEVVARAVGSIDARRWFRTMSGPKAPWITHSIGTSALSIFAWRRDRTRPAAGPTRRRKGCGRGQSSL